MTALAAWIAAAAVLSALVVASEAAVVLPGPAGSTTARSCISGVSALNTGTVLAGCYLGLMANLSAQGLVSANWSSVDDAIQAIGAFEPLALDYWAAFIGRWPLMFSGAASGFQQFTWADVTRAFSLHCRSVVGPFSTCAVAAAAPLCPADRANVRNLMSAWAGRYCDVTNRVPKAAVLTRLRGYYNTSMNLLSCTVNSTRAGANFRNDIGNFLDAIYSECMDITGLSIWAMQFTTPAVMDADIFSLSAAVKPMALSFLRCGFRAYDRYCPGALDANWAMLSYTINLLLPVVFGGSLTSADLSWKLAAANVGATAPHSVAGSYDGWFLTPPGSQWVKCATSGNASELLLTNQYSTVVRAAFSTSGTSGQYVSVAFYHTVGTNRTYIGSYGLTIYLSSGVSGVIPTLTDAKGNAVTKLTVGGRDVVTLQMSSGIYTVKDMRATTTYRLYGTSGKAALVVNAPTQLVSRSFGSLAQGCIVPISGVSLPVPKAVCLAAKTCSTNKACSKADCSLVNAYQTSGWAAVIAATKF